MALEIRPLMDRRKPARQILDQHVARFNELGEVMAAASDYYDAAKSGDGRIIDALRKGFHAGVICGESISYASSTIIHNYGSTVAVPVAKAVVVPVFNPGILHNVLATREGLEFMQALFDSEDNCETIVATVRSLAGRSRVYVQTTALENRQYYDKRSIVLAYVVPDGLVISDSLDLGIAFAVKEE